MALSLYVLVIHFCTALDYCPTLLIYHVKILIRTSELLLENSLLMLKNYICHYAIIELKLSTTIGKIFEFQ